MHKSLRVKQYSGQKLSHQALSEIGASLTDIDWRLLYWLLRYPLQRTDDLVVGVARWASRATVYRHVQALEAHGLLESVLPKMPGTGKRLYHLSNSGLHPLARHLARPARVLARRWQADEAGLLRLLPRLPTLLVLQEVVNGLVTHAAEAMTIQGRRPELVRWNWQRDLAHRFQYREQRMRFFADGVLALCIRTLQNDGGVQEQWYGLMLLCTELDDERLMRLRLERLLYWRESPERWPIYRHMLQVLVLARSQRQRDLWQRAMEATALRLRLEPLIGALSCLPREEDAHRNPWLLTWRTLATEVSCHLQEVLLPLPLEAFPPSLQLEERENEPHELQSPLQAAPRMSSSCVSARLSRLIIGGFDKRAARLTQAGMEEQEAVSLLGLRLTSHPWLSDEELASLLGLQQKSVRCSLYELHQLGCLESVLTSAGRRWHLCERGLYLTAFANHMHIRTIAVSSDDETDSEKSTMTQRGEAWLFQHIQHTSGIYHFFASLAQAVSKEPEQALCWWETGKVCERRYRVGEQWYNLRPDALADYRVGQQHLRFWLEWDRGTMNRRDLAIKFASYGHYLASREWAREGPKLPALVCVAPDIAQERRIQRVAQARLASVRGFELWTTTEVLLNEHGPLAPIWLQDMPQRSHVLQTKDTYRQCVFDEVLGKN